MKYHFKTSKEDSRLTAQCVEVPACVVSADSKEELLRLMAETISLYFNEASRVRVPFPKPERDLNGRKIIAVPLDLKTAWAVSLRNARLHRGLTQMEAARLLEIRNLHVYQKLESSKTANPGLVTIAKIKKVFPELDLEEIFST